MKHIACTYMYHRNFGPKTFF